jgi:hypothetical protein
VVGSPVLRTVEQVSRPTPKKNPVGGIIGCIGAFGAYSIFGIAVDRRHALKWLFPQEKATFHRPQKVYVYSENALILVLIRPYRFGALTGVALTHCVREAEEVTSENSRQEHHGQHKRFNGPLGNIHCEWVTWQHSSSEPRKYDGGSMVE